MQSKKSFFNLALFKKNISRTWIVGLLYFIILLIVMPIQFIINLANFDEINYEEGYTKTLNLIDDISYVPIGVWGIFIAIAVTGITFWYLFFKRDNYMMHSFPVSRRSLYFTGLISSIVVSILPVILTALVTTIVAAAEKIYAFDIIWFWALGVSATTLLFIGIAMISLMASGQIVTSIIFYGIFNFLYLMMEVAFRITASILMFGMTNSVNNISFNALTPVLFVDDACKIKVFKMYDNLGNIKTYTYTLPGLKFLLIYIAVAIALIVVSYILYEFKKLETVQDFIAIPFLKPVFTIGMSFFISMVAGALVAGMIEALKPMYYNTRFIVAIISALVIGCIVFYATQMLIEKTFRVFSTKKFFFLAGYSLASLAMLICLRMDVFNVENKVPDAADIQWVGIDSNYVMVFSTPEDISAVRDLHKNFLSDKKELRDVNKIYNDVDSGYFTIKYKLKKGNFIERTYSVVNTESDKVSANYLAATQPILDYLNNPTRIKEHVIGNIWDDCTVPDLTFSQYVYNEEADDYWPEYADFETLTDKERCDKNEKIYQAFLKDIDEGNAFVTTFGDRYNNTEIAKITLYNDFNFTVANNKKEYFSDEMTFWDWYDDDTYYRTPEYERSIYAQLTTNCTNTLKALKDEGFYTDDSQIITSYEYNKAMGYLEE